MGEIRALERSHIPEVAALEFKTLRKLNGPISRALEQYFASIFLENPWRSDDLPSLVYLHQGRVAGFLGVVPRPMDFDGRRIRVAVASQLMADRDLYPGFAGLELLKKFFRDPQDVSYTDGATEAAYLSWTALRARAAPLYSLEWTRVLKHTHHLAGLLKEKGGKWRMLAQASAPATILADAAISSLPLRSVGAPVSDSIAEDAGVGDLLEAIEEIGWRDPLRPAYEPKGFAWLIDQAASASVHGMLRLCVVRNAAGKRVGWFVYYAKRGGLSQVLQLGARPRAFEGVLLALLADAWQLGAAAVRGQAIPRHLTNFTAQHCDLRHLGSGVLIYSREQAIMDAVLKGEAALSRLDGEWWMRFAVEDWR